MSKSRIDEAFQEKLAKDQKLFIPYIMAGDGGLDNLDERIEFLQSCGASAVELGIPFSDPVADGPTIQNAGLRALKNGTSLSSVLQTLTGRKTERTIPIILMTYFNPVYIYGIERFTNDCAEAGVDGVIIPDLPLEEERLIERFLQEKSIAFVRLAALTSNESRLAEIAKRTEGFLYAVSVTGTTGAKSSHSGNVKGFLQGLKKIANVPVLAGFGVSNADQAKELGGNCDGVIVGSKIVDLFHEGKRDEIKSLIENSL
ncbi:tryptophan synthase subunit alpha [Virgibacillus phasianinus]|uniref:Tryptophan synthase alpha chain n=1 Tax=Virgibacillus phasianinus TaxID=2017483 RepID=A0A220U028_9BACI|nr:tryptophan synthase subunit alpha [Virgibacillus phasianinus]ASK61458.1 tryptophan synthase subunit alpha [Virgibacillus phasianinus]